MRKLLFTLTITSGVASTPAAAAPAGFNGNLAPSTGSQKTLATSGNRKPVVIPCAVHQLAVRLERQGVGPHDLMPGHMRAVIV
jgi:hypothetical protein